MDKKTEKVKNLNVSVEVISINHNFKLDGKTKYNKPKSLFLCELFSFLSTEIILIILRTKEEIIILTLYDLFSNFEGSNFNI